MSNQKPRNDDETLVIAVANQNSDTDVQRNLNQMARWTLAAAEAGADLIVFPENAPLLCPSAQKLDEAEPIDGTQILTIRQFASANNIGLLVGSFSEMSDDPDRVFNTSLLLGRDGKTIAEYRKMHLFDVAVAGDTVFRESETTCAGPTEPVVADFEGWKIGLSICYDLRFPELYRQLSAAGAEILMVPSAFTFRTGSAHWEVLLRARAIENLAYVVAPAQTGRCYEGRESWGHAMVVSPWGVIAGQAGEHPELFFVTVNRRVIEEARRKLPSLDHRRISCGR